MYYSNRDVRVEEMASPEIGPGEILVKVRASGICGSDVMEWYRAHKVPLVLGHEIAGEIVAVGNGIEGYRTGDRISASHHVPCNTCHYCMNGHPTVCETLRTTHFHPGGFSELIRLPAINVDRGVYRLPAEVTFEEATFIEPLACVIRGQRMAGVEAGRRVLVIGSGIAGLLHVQMARALGASRVVATDLADYRLKAALELGADQAFNAAEDVPARLREVNDGRLADVVILCTGASAAILQGIQSVERGGTVLFFAPAQPGEKLPLPINDLFWRNEITLTSSYAGAPADHHTALELIRSRRVKVREMITHRLGLEETGLGFRLVTEAKESIKVIIDPQR
jgi:L-iditol 2-dehydrogenase